MRHSTRRLLTMAAVALTVVPLLAQQAAAPAAAKKAAAPSSMTAGIPRTPDGHPDLQGTYDLGTLTPLERPTNTTLVLTYDQALALENRPAQQNDQRYASI